MDSVYTVDQIRRAEQPLLEAQEFPDELMQSAAGLVADAARVMLQRRALVTDGRILLAVGGGGNGGDALYAGARLLDDGWDVDAVLLGSDRTTGDTRVHDRALGAFTGAGGTVVSLQDVWPRPPKYRLLIDGVLGTGGAGGVDGDAAVLFTFAATWFIPVLAIDVPSGIDADTGEIPGLVDIDDPVDPEAGTKHPEGLRVLHADRVPGHAIADVTVTFGGLRRAHATTAYCGQVVVGDPRLGAHGDDGSIGVQLERVWWADRQAGEHTDVQTAVAAVPEYPEPRSGGVDRDGPFDFSGTDLEPVSAACYGGPHQPGPYDDKYTGGVVGVCAGSSRYPGAAVLATTGAVRTTSAMVRYVGSGSGDVLRATPEVVCSPAVAETGRVQAWVIGPGRGTDDGAADELAELLSRAEPLLIDADAITQLAERADLRHALVARSDEGIDGPTTLITPHDGEFRRLADAVNTDSPGTVPDPDTDRIGAAVAMATALHCEVLLKGRHSIIVERPVRIRGRRQHDVHTIDAGTSWGATPGSGDVLAGMAGAMMAQSQAQLGRADHVLPEVVALHGRAAEVAAQTGEGYAPTSASRIAEAIPLAWARSSRPITDRRYRLPRPR